MMKVKELMEVLEKADPDDVVICGAENAPPWVTKFNLQVVKESDLESN